MLIKNKLIFKDIVHLDNITPVDNCPFKSHNLKKHNSILFIIKQKFKQLLFGFISQRLYYKNATVPRYPKSILVATGGNLGGAIISLPLLKGIREKWPDSFMVVVSNRLHGLEIIQKAGIGDAYYVIPEISLLKSFISYKNYKKYKEFKKKITLHKPEIFIGNFNLEFELLLPLFRKINFTIGHTTFENFDPHLYSYDRIVKYDFTKENWLLGYWNILQALDIHKFDYPKLSSNVSNALLLFKREFNEFDLSKLKLVGIQASVWEKEIYKAYPVERMAELCCKIWEDLQLTPIIIGASGQNDLPNYINLKYPNLKFINAVGVFKVNELPDILKLCQAVISNDSGLMHMSASLDVPTLAIYGMTDSEISWVYGNKSIFKIIKRQNIKPCYQYISDVNNYCKSKDCIKNISVETILINLKQIINL